jgi:hypothetical protein
MDFFRRILAAINSLIEASARKTIERKDRAAAEHAVNRTRYGR